MFFNLLHETILRDQTDGKNTYQYVYGQEKETFAKLLNGQITGDIKREGMYLYHRNRETNTVEEALNRAPMFINAIKNRGYKNILFVGHYNTAFDTWVLPDGHPRLIDVFPPERKHMGTQVDPNIILQFLPIVYRLYGYKGNYSVVQPAPSFRRGIMHSLYNQNGLGPRMLPSVEQYKHGIPVQEFGLSASAEKFDAVVFLGVPKYNEQEFNLEQVKQAFADHCTADADFIDLYYGAPDSSKWVGGEPKEVSADLEVAWTTRAQWEENWQKNGGRPEEYEIFKRMFKVY